jgi:dihydroflavonol-4-reductase
MTVLMNSENGPRHLAIYGASGFIGCHLAAALLRQGHHVRALVRSKTKAELLHRLGLDVVLGDIRDPQAVRLVAEGCSHVFHLVSNRDDFRLAAYNATNVSGTANVISAAAEARVRRLVFTSSINVYGRLPADAATEDTPAVPILYHDRSKLEAERIVLRRGQELGVSVVVARLPWVFGAGQFRFHKTFRQISEGGVFMFYGPHDPWRNIAHVDDVLDGLKRCAGVITAEPRIYLLPGHNATLTEVLQLIAEEAGVRFRMKRRPLWPAESISQVCRLLLMPLRREPGLARGIEFFVRNHRIDGSKAHRELGYTPVISLRQTIRDMITWYRNSSYADSNEPLLVQMAGLSS